MIANPLSNDKTKIILDVVIIGAVIFVIYYILKLVKGVGNVGETILTNPASEGAESAADKAGQALNTIKQKPTKSEAEMQTISNAIFDAGRVYNMGLDIDEAKIYRELTKMQNDADVLLLVKTFGAKYRYTFGIPTAGPYDLFTFVKNALGDSKPDNDARSYITLINTNWSRKSTPIKARL